MKIAIIGLGYVGLPLSLQFARSGVEVLGLDVDQVKVDAILAGNGYIKHIESSEIARHVAEGFFGASTDFARISEVDAVIICVPTPLNKHREPDLSYVLNTGRAIAPYLGPEAENVQRGPARSASGSVASLETTFNVQCSKEEAAVGAGANAQHSNFNDQLSKDDGLSPTRNQKPDTRNLAPRPKLVVLESTTYPGTTDEDLRAVLEEGSGLKAGEGFHLAFSPEREDPGNPNSKVAIIPKVVGGYTSACLERARELYSKAIQTLVPVSSCRAAEATKLLENIFRSVNIALVNELKVIYDAMGIDIWEVVEAAKTKPFGYMPFYPGPGLGGHCIPIDPFYLTWKAREYGKHTRFIELAGEINTSMPEYVVGKVAEALNAQKKAVNGSRILIIGLAYKPNVDDDRESPSYVLMDLLKDKGAELGYYDPHVPVIRPTREHGHWEGLRSVGWDRWTIAEFDCAVISTAHSEIDFRELALWVGAVVDTRNAIARAGGRTSGLVKA
jgi:UDP-N-acetyl-D-glucosamine dehydrogenase